MLELLKSLGFALLMVPVVMVLIMGIIYGLGEVFNLISPSQPKADKNHNFSLPDLEQPFIL